MKRGLIVAAVIALAYVIGASLVDRGICSYYGLQTDRQVRYAAFVGCMVQTPAGWVPRSELRVVQ
ncbi:hypothetical protein KJY40_21410 [Pseudomonas fitomaticsae]|uniref:Uncharacterized protein n=1 Tax=Pseudomonas fitomaticsae TaxID=2837969 RepID=A0ABY3QA51_9PSED|nr:hypothetical protein KJY40_21410 [Pseudomonas fitomaticsae]